MRYALLIAILTMMGCEEVTPLVPIQPCGLPCAITSDSRLVFEDEAYAETCNVGTSVCDYSGDGPVTVTCPDFIPISDEVCDPDNIDEDCNGVGNDLWYEYYDWHNTCNGVGECYYSAQVCQPDGSMVCVPESRLYGPEVCDGEDNDCDGLTDEEDPDLTYDGSQFEYTGPPETLNVGECRAGVRRCENGLEYLFGEVLPTAEICGNTDDDDCDGLTDEDEGDGVADAFLLSIDFSGSMSGTIEAVIEALCDWSGNNTFVNSRFAVQAIAGDYQTSPFIINVTDFVTAGDACVALRDFYTSNGTPGGTEFVPYGIWSVNNVDELHMDWPADMRRRVIFFTDEPAQGNNADWDAMEDISLVTQDCSDNKYSVGGFVSTDYATWHQMTDPCAGWLETLSYDPERMREDLDYRFGSECGDTNVSGGTL